MQRRTSEPPALPGYEYVRVLGSGGFSDVFLYNQAFPKRSVAVKVLLLDDLTDESRAAFTAEANVMAQLSTHPYIVTILQAAVADDDRPYLMMEYCSGPSLADQYKQAPLPVAQTLELGVRLASAIATAHAAGILHRDIKPANVLTNQFGWPALTDFGIASTVDELAPTMTTTSHASGSSTTGGGTASVGMSIPWSPPEMFDDFPKPDVRSDVFSLAATLYTVLAGHTPFEVPGRSNGSVDLIGRIARGSVTPLTRSDVPSSLAAVLQKGMSNDPEDRYANAVEFGRALQRIEVELSYPQTPLDVPNLTIARPERAAAGEESSADETRARPIPTVRAQVAAPPITAPPAPAETVVRTASTVPALAALDETQRRPSATVDASTVRRPAGVPAVDGELSSAQPVRVSRRVVTVSVVGAIVLIAAVIGVSAFVSSGARQPTSTASHFAGQNAGGQPAGETTPAKPSTPIAVKTSDGKHVTFTWTDPTATATDEYKWAPLDSDGAQGQTNVLQEPTITVGYSGGTSCIRVWTFDPNASKLSPPVKGCLSE